MTTRYQDLLSDLRASYDGRAGWRDRIEKEGWKLAERSAFLDRLRADGHSRLLEIGAGTGHDSEYLQANGSKWWPSICRRRWSRSADPKA